ncbi:MAG TPA: response regulator [Methanocorpusculum sp.]|nr:response regulator [Methanocorpusculum sp.]
MTSEQKLGSMPVAPEIYARTRIGQWAMEIDEDNPPRLYIDDATVKYIGFGDPLSPEETYQSWFARIDPASRPLIAEAAEKLKTGGKVELIYVWHHPSGKTYDIRSIGMRNSAYTKGIRFEGLYQNATDVTHLQEEVLARRLDEKYYNLIKYVADKYIQITDIEIETGAEIHIKDSAAFREIRDRYTDTSFYARFADYVNKYVVEEDRAELIKNAAKDRILAGIRENGEYILQCRVKVNGKTEWLEGKFFASPEFPDTHFINTLRFITREVEKREQDATLLAQKQRDIEIIEGLADDFVSVYHIDIETEKYRIYRFSSVLNAIKPELDAHDDFPTVLKNYIDTLIHEEDRKACRAFFDLENIRAALVHKKSMRIFFRRNFDGNWLWMEALLVKTGDIDAEPKTVIVAFAIRDSAVKNEKALAACIKTMGSGASPVDIINKLLASAGEFYGADRAYIFEYSQDRTTVSNTAEWCAKGIKPVTGETQNLNAEEIAFWLPEFKRSGAFFFENTENNAACPAICARLKENGISSLIAAPVMNGGEISGFICVDNPKLSKKNITTLKNTAVLAYGVLLRRKETDEEHVTLAKLADTFLSVAYVDLSRDYVRACKIDAPLIEKHGTTAPYYTSMVAYVNKNIAEDDRMRVIQLLSPEHILNEFKTSAKFSIEMTKAGRNVMFDLIRISDDGSRFVLCCTDITDAVAKEKELQKKLTAAEESAKFIENFASCYHLVITADLSDESYSILKEEGYYSGKMMSFGSISAVCAFFIGQFVYPADRELMMHEMDPERVRAHLSEMPSYSIEFRVMRDGIGIWNEMVITSMGADNVAIGFIDRDMEILSEHISKTLLNESLGLYVVNLDSDQMKILKASGIMSGETRTVKYSTAVRNLAITLTGNAHLHFMQTADVSHLRRVLKEEGRTGSVFLSPNFNGKHIWVKTEAVPLTFRGTEPETALVRVTLIDSLQRRKLELEEAVARRQAEKDANYQRVLSLSGTFESLYEIDLETGGFEAFVQNNTRYNDFYSAHVTGGNFYEESAENCELVIYEEDRSLVHMMNSPEKQREVLKDRDSYEWYYRMLIDDKPVWYKNRLIYKDGEKKKVILGVFNAEEEVAAKEQIIAQQEMLENALVRAEEANKAKNTFFFGMSHDLRTPLNAIIGYSNIALKDLSDTEKVRLSLEKTRDAGSLLNSLISGILDMSSIESGSGELEESPGDVMLTFTGIREEMQLFAEARNIDLEFSFGEITDRYVYADFERCGRVLINIITNGVKYTNAGGYVRVRCEQTASKGGIGTYRYTIADNGIGMSEEFRKHLFDILSSEPGTETNVSGKGLGLSICKSFIDLMKGTIECESKQGVGTTFTVTIPFRLQDGRWATWVDPKTGELISAQGEAASEKPDFTGKRVLLVEDNEMNCEIASDILEDEGMIVETAENGKVAVDMVKEHDPAYYDFILMDIQMPVMNGYEAAKAIRNIKGCANLPIIAVSANALDEDKKEALAAGMNAHVAKPIDVKKLYRALVKHGRN